MKNYKKIHIWDLPTNKIYAKFNKEFREKFFNFAHKRFGNFNLVGEFLNVKRADTTIARNWREGVNCCPLNLMIKLANKIGISLTELEKNINEIRYKSKINKKGGNSGKLIINPILPIIINEDFSEILGHICGDGFISKSNLKKGISFRYINSELTLIKNFKKLVKQVFGEMEPNIQIRKKGKYTKPNYYLQYPSIISAFVLLVFDYKPDKDMDVPSFIFNVPKEAKTSFLKAMFDDEGWVTEKNKKIQLGLKPIKPLLNIKKLLNEGGIKTSNIYKSNTFNRFEISGQDNILLFSKIIGFKHPKKNKRLNNIIKKGWKFKRYYNNEPKDKIMNILRNKEGLTVSKISKILQRSKGNIREHLYNLKKDGKIFSKKIQQRINNTNSFPNLWFVYK